MNAAEAEAATVVSSTHFLLAPVRPVNDIVTSFLKSVQRKEPSCFSSIFFPHFQDVSNWLVPSRIHLVN